ncbi:MAG: phosphate/phosphite/phosphonate ABC transporter substrate-binding protein [Parasulfuritortus sp.]|nr:phosphate/phosphite/phosphonate ABC transporter substrate-binding protein [Parasulfuritortus sp.]
MKRLLIFVVGLFWCLSAQAVDSYSFGVLPQRSLVLTAEYWNPILDYVSRKAAIDLKLKVARTGTESSAAAARGEYDFIYSNHIFRPDIVPQRYQVILRPREEAIRGQIVTLDDSPIRTLADLNGRETGFPSKSAFVGYTVPMDHLLRKGVNVTPVFGGNQEGIMGQLKAGKVAAAGVNNQVMRVYAAREGIRYRVLWESPSYNNLPVAAHPRVPKAVVRAVQKAFVDMNDDPEGARILAVSAAVIGQPPPFGFQRGSRVDYRNNLDFYKHTLVKDIE